MTARPAAGRRPDWWPAYGHDLGRTFSGRTTLTGQSVRILQRRWFFPTNDAVTATPVVVNGTVYVGSWDGYFYAINLKTGNKRWKFRVKSQPAVHPHPGERQPQDLTTDGGIITSSAFYVKRTAAHPALVVFGGGYTLYALRAATGKLYWRHDYTGAPSHPPNPRKDPTRIFSSPAVVGRHVLFGVTPDGELGYRGYFASADLRTGKPQWVFETDRQPSGRVAPDGCGGVWSSPTIDSRHGLVVFGVADCHNVARPRYHERLVALHYRTGKQAWVFTPPRLRRSDPPCDFDVGATANFRFGPPGKPRFLGFGGKDGTYYSVEPKTGRLRWATNVVFGGSAGGFIGTTAYDGHHAFGATGLGDFGGFGGTGGAGCVKSDPRDTTFQEPSMFGFDGRTGKVLWEGEQSHSVSATTVAGGMTFVGTLDSKQIQIRDAKTGLPIHLIPLGATCESGIVVAGNSVIFGTGSQDQVQPAGVSLYTPGAAAPSLRA